MKNQHLIIFFVVSVLVGALTEAHAFSAPMKFAECASRVQVTPVANGAGVFFDESCQVAYVLPPASGEMRLTAMAASQNVAACREVTALQDSTALIANRVRDILKNGTASPARRSGPFGGGPSGGGPFGEVETPSKSTAGSLSQSEVRELLGLLKDIREAGGVYAGVQGATATMIYSLSIEDLVRRYQAANPHITFRALPLVEASLSFHPANKENLGEAPSVLSFAVPGLGQLPLANEQQAPGDLQGRFDARSEAASGNSRIFGQSMTGQVVLSLPGTCPFVNPSTGKLKNQLEPSEIAAHMVANVQYVYQLQSTRKYQARYNVGSLVRQLKESVSSGGLFHTRTVQTFINERNSRDWFELVFAEDDDRFPKSDLVREIKTDLFARVLKQIGYTKVGASEKGVDTTAPKPLGASIIAGKVRDGCSHEYCQAGALILEGLASVLGEESALARFVSTNDFWAKDDVTEKRMFRYTGSAGFTTLNASFAE